MSSLTVNRYFFSIHLTGPNLEPRKLLGTAFPIAPDGGLMTCRHVVEVNRGVGERVAVWDDEAHRMVPIEEVRYPQRSGLDMAFIPDALQRSKAELFPILSPERVVMGEDVYSFGYFRAGAAVDVGYFKGNIVNFSNAGGLPELQRMSVSYAVLEGLSGSPVLTYHNGPKVVGLCYGNTQSRILASEVIEYQDERLTLKETVNRIVELGQAYHVRVVTKFLEEVGAQGYVVSSERVPGVIS